jgi:hypothetical protein
MASGVYIHRARGGFKQQLGLLVDLGRERRKLKKLCTGEDAVACPECEWIGPPRKLPFHRRVHA